MSKTSILSPFNAIKFLFKKPKTLRYPFEPKEPASRYRGFHLNDWEKCTGCGNCADICPNQAITMIKIPGLKTKPGEKNERPQIDYGRCCFCGLCVDICPAGSLRLSRDYFHIHFDTNTFVFIPKDEKTDKEHFLPEEKYSIFQASLTHRKADYEGFTSDLKYTLFEPERVPMPMIKPKERSLSFIEFVLGYSKQQAKKEAERCLECGLCEDACPAHLKITDYIKAIYNDEPEESLRKIFEDNPLPAICGRICMKHCETACSLSIRGEAVAIRWLKRYTADTIKDYEKALLLKPAKPTGKKVAIIGAGPSGLALAYFLILKGYKPVIFESLPFAGGMIRIGPPSYRLPAEAIDKDVEYLKKLGVQFKFRTEVGKDITFKSLLRKYDAVYMSVGLHKPFKIGIPGEEKTIPAIEFLKNVKLKRRVKIGRVVIVIGGGNVAMDAARTCIRLQNMQYGNKKKSVRVISLERWDEMPATEEEKIEAGEEGIIFTPGWGVKEIKIAKGKITGIVVKKVKSVFDEKGRFNPTFNENITKEFNCDMIIEAIGQTYDLTFIPEDLLKKLKFTERRKIKVDKNGMTTIPKLFAGGDIVNTNLDTVTAIADAKIAAEGIHKFLSK